MPLRYFGHRAMHFAAPERVLLQTSPSLRCVISFAAEMTSAQMRLGVAIEHSEQFILPFGDAWLRHGASIDGSIASRLLIKLLSRLQ